MRCLDPQALNQRWSLGGAFKHVFSYPIHGDMIQVDDWAYFFSFWGGKKTTNWNSILYHQLLNIVLFFLSIILVNFGRPWYVTDGCFLWECNFSGALVTVCLPPFGMSLFSSNYSNLSKYHQLALQKNYCSVPLFCGKLWLVLWVKLMVIKNNLFSRYQNGTSCLCIAAVSGQDSV